MAVAADVPLSQLIATLQDQLPNAEIIGVAQNQAPTEPLTDLVELTIRLWGHPEALVFRATYDDLHSGFLVVTLNAYVENILRIYALGDGGPTTGVPPVGSDQPPGPTIGPGPVLP